MRQVDPTLPNSDCRVVYRLSRVPSAEPDVEERAGQSGRLHPQHWAEAVLTFDYAAEVELSNNPAQNSMRPVTLGGKNWLHVGSAKAGPEGRGRYSRSWTPAAGSLSH